MNNGFLDTMPKIKASKEKIDKLDFTKIKNFSAVNNTIKKGRAIHRNGENICKVYLTGDLYREYTKNNYNSIIKTKLNLKMQK